MTRARRKKARPDDRLVPFLKVVFADAPVSKLPRFDEAMHAALDASHHGVDRHGGRKKPAIDWQSVVDSIIAAGRVDVISMRRIRAESVREVLGALKQTKEVKDAAGNYPAFIKWVQRWRKRERRLIVKNM
jgi:hypothetical protein